MNNRADDAARWRTAVGKNPSARVSWHNLAAERHVRPQAGSLVLFPAYMWHGVEPFESATPRLSVAFDVVPR